MATFTKLSLRNMIIMPIITLQLYFPVWLWISKDELNSAGGRIPRMFLIFVLPALLLLVGLFILVICAPAYAAMLDPRINIYSKLVIMITANLLALFFWWRYTQAYVTLVKKSIRSADFWYYFAVALLPAIGSYIFWWLLPMHNLTLGWQSGVNFLVSYILYFSRMLIFQKGFNEYKE